jgi:hypothetical protein
LFVAKEEIMTDKIVLDVERKHVTDMFGVKGYDRYPCKKGKISKIEFSRNIQQGNSSSRCPGCNDALGEAFPVDTELPDLAVHYWAGRNTILEYTLKVWAKDEDVDTTR